MKNSIRYFRKIKGLTQSELAQNVGCSKNTISSLERGEFDPTLKLAYSLAKYFDVSIENLFFLSDFDMRFKRSVRRTEI